MIQKCILNVSQDTIGCKMAAANHLLYILQNLDIFEKRDYIM